MMNIKSKTEIRVVKHEIRTVRINSGGGTFCRTCGEQTTTFTAEQLASFLDVEPSEVCCRIEAAEIHLASSDRGIGLICGNSVSGISRQMQQKND